MCNFKDELNVLFIVCFFNLISRFWEYLPVCQDDKGNLGMRELIFFLSQDNTGNVIFIPHWHTAWFMTSIHDTLYPHLAYFCHIDNKCTGAICQNSLVHIRGISWEKSSSLRRSILPLCVKHDICSCFLNSYSSCSKIYCYLVQSILSLISNEAGDT